MRYWFSVLISALFLGLSPAFAEESHDLVPAAQDLAALAEDARRSGAPILLVFSAEDCDYCVRLESEVLGPMRLSGVEPTRVIVRKVMVEDYKKLRDFQGHTLSASSYAQPIVCK